MKHFQEIGSSFWLKPEDLEPRAGVEIDLQFVAPREQVVYSSSGRGAISLLLSQRDQKQARALLPMYTCESVIQPFALRGYSVDLYEIQRDLSFDAQEFHRQVAQSKPAVVLFHAYFGFDTLGAVRRLYPELKRSGITVIEDLTHSMFSGFAKPGADYYLSSLRKWLCLPDGGAAISPRRGLRIPPAGTHDPLIDVNLRAIRLKDEYSRTLDPERKAEYRRLFYSADHMLDADCGYYSMSPLSRSILGRTDLQTLRSARRRNYAHLLRLLQGNRLIAPVFPALPSDVVPLYFPVYVASDRDRLRAFLAEGEIYAPVHWPVPGTIVPRLSGPSRFIFDHVLSLPCDQRYEEGDMERVALRLSEFPG